MARAQGLVSAVGPSVRVSPWRAVVRAIQALFGIYNVLHYGAKGDGVTDDYPAILAAAQAANAAGSGVVFFPSRSYKTGTTISILPGVAYRGAPGAAINFSTATKTGSIRYGMRGLGSLGTQYSFTADVTKGLYTATASTSDAANLSPGDWVQVGTTNATDVYPYLAAGVAGGQVGRGEIKRVLSVATGTITFEQALYDNYTVANGAFVAKITPVSGFSISGIKFVSNNTPNDGSQGVVLDYCDDWEISNCKFEAIDVQAIVTNSSIRGRIHGNTFRGVRYNGGVGFNFYGIYNGDCCQWIRVSDNYGEQLRHLWVCGGRGHGQGYYGGPRYLTVTGNVAQSMQGGNSGRSWAYEHHGVGEAIVVANNTADSCFGGFVARGPGISFVNNIIRNWYDHAIEIHNDTVDAREILIAGNEISDVTSEGGGAPNARALYLDLSNATTIENVVVRNNVIRMNRTQDLALVTVGGAANGQSLVIEDNDFYLATGMASYQFQLNLPFMKFLRNRIYETTVGVRPFVPDCVIDGNEFHNAVDPVSGGAAIWVDQLRTVVRNNRGHNCFRGIFHTTGGDNSTFQNNCFRGHSDAVSYAYSTALGIQSSGNVIPQETVSLTAAATLTLPFSDNSVYTITGNTNITAITAAQPGRRVTLIFTGTPTVTDGGNLKLAGNFVAAGTTNDPDTLTAVCDGTNWYEQARSVN